MQEEQKHRSTPQNSDDTPLNNSTPLVENSPIEEPFEEPFTDTNTQIEENQSNSTQEDLMQNLEKIRKIKEDALKALDLFENKTEKLEPLTDAGAEEKVVEKTEVPLQPVTPISYATVEVDGDELHIDYGDEEEEEKDVVLETEEEIDYYSQYENADIEVLLAAQYGLNKQEYTKKTEKEQRAVYTHFEDKIDQIRREALAYFIENGGEKDSFEFHNEINNKFQDALRIWRDKKSAALAREEAEKNNNLKRKIEVLEKLRNLVESPEPPTSIEVFRQIQDEWKNIGPIPRQNKELAKNYSALVQRYFSNRSIYFELKDLDRKKNEEGKLEIIERAKLLLNEPKLNKAIKDLKELREEFKNYGPAPKGREQELWEEFKSVANQVHQRMSDYLAELEQKHLENYKQKSLLIEVLAPFANFETDRIDEWNEKTKEIQQLLENFKAIGPVPEDKLQEINDNFWKTLKTFYDNKNAFFKHLEAERTVNLSEKMELLEEARKWATNPDKREAANQLKALQRKWWKIGPLPHKHKKIQDEFKKICDDFFQFEKNKVMEEEKSQKDNLNSKRAIIKELLSLTQETALDKSVLTEKYKEYMTLGFVPKEDLKKLSDDFDKAFDHALSLTGLSLEDTEAFKISLKLGLAEKSENARQDLQDMLQSLRGKIRKMEDEVALYEQNLSLFSKSKNADALRNSVQEKIQGQINALEKLKAKQKMIQKALNPPKKKEEPAS